MPIYMKYGDIAGNVTTDGYKGWIELSSAQFGVSRQLTSGAGGAQRESSAPSVSEIVITKVQDASSAQLFKESVGARHGNPVQIKFATTSKNKIETYLTLELSDCAVSSYTLSGHGGDQEHPQESLSLNFTKILYVPTPLDNKGNVKTGDRVQYDLTEMKAG
ncbi:MAG: type VI secretion system tube protein Hcp [Proteobacteria bacterium]|nr:type VI secretion system tube protein Hcp [Pseudomonadota bacterium]